MATDKIFQENPKLDVYYKTSDGTAFFTMNAAKAHGNTLKNKVVEKVTRKAEKASTSKNDDAPAEQAKVKLVRKDVVKAYVEKFNEEPSNDFTAEEIADAIEKGVKLENPA
ncbi:MAG: hypothetical protein E2590_12810 [Chryseobacterium sp.]|nr:hypothetical protein [Chryseobacterium sp.]